MLLSSVIIQVVGDVRGFSVHSAQPLTAEQSSKVMVTLEERD